MQKKIKSFYEVERENYQKNQCCTDFGIYLQPLTEATNKWNYTDSSLTLTYKGLFETENYPYSTIHINQNSVKLFCISVKDFY